MADIYKIDTSINHKYKDLGDGSYAEVMALDGGITIGDITLSNVEITNDVGNPIPVTGPITNTQLRAEAVPVTIKDALGAAVVQGLTEAQLRGLLLFVTDVKDSTGEPFSPESAAHIYTYTGGLLATDTATDGVNVWVQTYTYTAGVLTTKSQWVKQ